VAVGPRGFLFLIETAVPIQLSFVYPRPRFHAGPFLQVLGNRDLLLAIRSDRDFICGSFFAIRLLSVLHVSCIGDV
jgi:hypothetical protein